MSTSAALSAQATAQPDLPAVKQRQHGAWSSGDYAVVGTTLQIVGEQLCEALDLRAGSKVLDVAAGNGNVTLAAARRWCDVTSTDYVPALLNRGRERAAAERLTIEFREADAEALPFPDASYDVVVSTFGVMFTPDQDKAASELARVCKSGGKIGLANWTPQGFIGQLFKTIEKKTAPPAGVKSPALPGTSARLQEMFGSRGLGRSLPSHACSCFAIARRSTGSRFSNRSTARCSKPSPRSTRPARLPCGAISMTLLGEFNDADDGTVVVHSEYLEAVITKR